MSWEKRDYKTETECDYYPDNSVKSETEEIVDDYYHDDGWESSTSKITTNKFDENGRIVSSRYDCTNLKTGETHYSQETTYTYETLTEEEN